jgi:hypothetical protein
MIKDKQEKVSLGWMPFYYERFAWSVRGWPSDAAYAYLMLLCEQWSAGSLDPDPVALNQVVKGVSKNWKFLHEKFELGHDGRLRNSVCESMREKAVSSSERRKNAAKAGSLARWGSSAHPNRITKDMRIASDSHRNEIEIENEIDIVNNNMLKGKPFERVGVHQIHQKVSKISGSEIQRVWELFPRKVGKIKATIAIRKAAEIVAKEFDLEDPADGIDYLVERVTEMAKRFENTEVRFIPHPLTWLNDGRYLDPKDA